MCAFGEHFCLADGREESTTESNETLLGIYIILHEEKAV
jgi:hypothetical protein